MPKHHNGGNGNGGGHHNGGHGGNGHGNGNGGHHNGGGNGNGGNTPPISLAGDAVAVQAPAPPPPTPPAPPIPPPDLAAQQSAFDTMADLLNQFGLSSLNDFIKNLILGGTTDSASLMLALQGTNEWKTRFAGNEMLRQKGLGVLNPAEYLAMERSYAQVMKNYGLPAGFYDDPSDYAKWIGNNISVNELQQRVSAFSDLAGREDPEVLNQLASMGLSRGDLLAHMMDPDRAAPLLQQTYKTTLLGAASRRAGYVADNQYLGQLASRGVSEQEASQGFGLIAGSLADATALAGVYGEDYGAKDMQAEIFENSGAAATKRKRLASRERAAFNGSAGVGSLTRNTSGSY